MRSQFVAKIITLSPHILTLIISIIKYLDINQWKSICLLNFGWIDPMYITVRVIFQPVRADIVIMLAHIHSSILSANVRKNGLGILLRAIKMDDSFRGNLSGRNLMMPFHNHLK